MTGHVLFGWAFSSYNQVFSCKQFGDFFLDRREVFVLHPSTKFPDSCQTLFNLLSDDWWCLIWMRPYKLQPDLFSCRQFGDFFLNRWEMFVPHPLTKTPDSCQALLNFIDWRLMMSHLHEVVQIAARFLAASNSVTFFSTDERCSFLIPWQKLPTAVKHFWILLSDNWWCLICMRLYKLQPGL